MNQKHTVSYAFKVGRVGKGKTFYTQFSILLKWFENIYLRVVMWKAFF